MTRDLDCLALRRISAVPADRDAIETARAHYNTIKNRNMLQEFVQEYAGVPPISKSSETGYAYKRSSKERLQDTAYHVSKFISRPLRKFNHMRWKRQNYPASPAIDTRIKEYYSAKKRKILFGAAAVGLALASSVGISQNNTESAGVQTTDTVPVEAGTNYSPTLPSIEQLDNPRTSVIRLDSTETSNTSQSLQSVNVGSTQDETFSIEITPENPNVWEAVEAELTESGVAANSLYPEINSTIAELSLLYPDRDMSLVQLGDTFDVAK